VNWLKKLNEDFEKNACSCLLLVMLVILSYQVVLRYCFHNSNSWSEELARYLFIWFIFIGASYATQQWAHIRLEASLNLYPEKARKYVKYIGAILWIAYNVVIIIVSTKFTITIYRSGQISLGMNLLLAYIYAAIPIGYALMTFRLLQRLVKGEI
jgi:TRAP-type C4-dicarboxylate transport system permease small subunit